jgi:hypothetical protein
VRTEINVSFHGPYLRWSCVLLAPLAPSRPNHQVINQTRQPSTDQIISPPLPGQQTCPRASFPTAQTDSFCYDRATTFCTMWRRTYFLLILVRIYFALSPSYLHPDENFQGPEVVAGTCGSMHTRRQQS